MHPSNKIFDQVLVGTWQLSGTHGAIHPKKVLENMHRYFENGFCFWDTADHYGPAEDFLGTFVEEVEERHGRKESEKIKILTKWVPTHPQKRGLPECEIDSAYITKNIDRSLKRLRRDQLYVLQLHWWDYEDQRLYDVMNELCKLKDQGKVLHLAVTNFDAKHFEKLLKDGYPIASNQVRYSLIDRRAEKDMLRVCQTYNVPLLAFGTLCGGLLSEKYLGQDDPERSLSFSEKGLYHKLINQFGGWSQFQDLLHVLDEISKELNCRLSSVASQFILGRKEVSSVIIGSRLQHDHDIDKTKEIPQIFLSKDQREKISNILDRGLHLGDWMGEVASEYRGKAFVEQTSPSLKE